MTPRSPRRLVIGRTLGAAALAIAVAGSVGTGTASAQSASPQLVEYVLTSPGSVTAPFQPSPVVPWPEPASHEHPFGASDTSDFLTPQDPDFWNPAVNADRLVSKYGLTTRIACTSFHGVTTGCWQADAEGNAHRLVELAANFPNVSGSLKPGGGPKTFVLPLTAP